MNIIEIFKDILNGLDSGSFYFDVNNPKSLKKNCNAPSNKSGVYIFITEYINTPDREEPNEDIVYIGCSGHIENDTVINRIGGLQRRIYGKQNGMSRGEFYKSKINDKEINKMKVCWFSVKNEDPEEIEYKLILRYITTYKRFPKFNNKLERKKENWI